MTKMIRLPVGGDQEQSPPDLTTGNGIQGENICTEIPNLRESAPKPTIKLQESSARTTPSEVDLAEQDLQTHRRTSHRLLTANRAETAGTTSTLSLSRSINGTTDSIRNSEQRMSVPSDPPSSSIICSLPLNRLESVLGMLNIIKKSPDHAAGPGLAATDAGSREHDRNNSSSAGSESTHDALNDGSLAYKVLCLYCDRSFSSQKLMIKHSDRIHRIAKDRRSSARVLSTALTGSDVSSCCHFCHKSKTLNLVSENLPELFKHLSSVHSDRYYACEHCTLRFPNDEAREAHMEALHPSTTNGRPKSKAALKAFSYGQNNCALHHQQPVVSVVNCKTLKPAGILSEATEPLSLAMELSSKPMERHVLTNRVNNSGSNSTKGESVVQNICLRSSLRNASAPTADKEAENGKSKTKAFKKSERLLRRNSEPMLLSRLGITQHRLPRQSRRLMAAASTTANAALLSSDTSSASSTSSTSSVMASCLGKFGTKKKGLILSNEEAQPVQNCYNKITKLKTIRSTLNTNAMQAADGSTIIEPTDSGKASGKGSDGTANVSAIVSSSGSSNDTSGGLNNRAAMHNSSLTCTSIWGNTSGSVSSNASNGSSAMLATSSGVFDEDFYETVTQNVKNNLSCHLDGKLEASTPYAPSPMSPVSVVPAVRSTVVKSPVSTDSKIHEATNLPAVSVMFPTLLTVEQYGTDPKPTTSTTTVASVSSGSSVKTKKPVTKNSWKWKWDFVKKYKYVNENGRIVKKIKQPTIGLRDLSKLDMWTQLTMRTKHELFQHLRPGDDQRQPEVSSAIDPSAKSEPVVIAEVGATLRHAKRAMVEQLDNILDARLLPHIDLEQNDQRIIKIEPSDEHATKEETSSLIKEPVDDKDVINVPPLQSSSLVPWSNHPATQARSKNSDFLHNLQLIQLNRYHQNSPVVLSGEWARPRCYICYGCGAKFNSLKQVEEHRIFRHPHVHSTFYEIVGRELIEKRLYKHFFIPVIALMMHRTHCMRMSHPERIMHSTIAHGMNPQHAGICRINTVVEIKNEDSSSNEATSFSTSTSASSSSSSQHSMNTTVSSTLMDTCTDAINVFTQCSALTIDDEDEGNGARSAICSKCQKECQNQILLYAHILHCSNDYVWLQAKKRMKYRRAKRRRGGNRNGASCAPPMLTIPRMVQSQQNAVEKVESTGYMSLSSTVDETHILNGAAASNTSLNNVILSSNVSSSSNSTCDSSSISNNSSVNGSDPSKVNSNQKVRRSPKPKENDSDIVKKLLANLPAKRNSRQTNSTTLKQNNKRSLVVARKTFSSTTVPIATKQKGHGAKHSSLHLGESAAAQPTSDNAATVHNGNDNVSNKILTTSSISPTEREIISQGETAATKLRTRQGLSSSATSASHVSPNKTQKVTCKKTPPTSENTDSDANCKRSSQESAHMLQSNPVTIKKRENIKRGKGVGMINKAKMLRWKKAHKHQLLRITNTSGQHRMLRSIGKHLLPVTVSIRHPSLSLRSIRHSTNGKNVLNKRHMLKRQKQLSTAVKFHDKTLDQKESITMENKDDTASGTVEVVCDRDSGQIPCIKIDSLLEAEALEETTAKNSKENSDADQYNVTKDIEAATDSIEPLAGSRITSSEPIAVSLSATQVTPTQLLKKQYCTDPPATPTKCDAEHAQQSLSSYSPAMEHNESVGTSGGPSSGGCKRRKKKLNDCIAMLTGKLSERLGVNFFNNENNIEEASQIEPSVSCFTTETAKLAPPTTTNSCSISADESSNHTKHDEIPLLKEQNITNDCLLPTVAPNNSHNASAPTISAPSDVIRVSPSVSFDWSNDYCQALTGLPPQTAPIRLKSINCVRSLSPNLATPSTIERLATSIESASEQIPDEPLNLSKNSPIGLALIRNAKVVWKQDHASSPSFKPLHSQQESSILGNSSSAQTINAHHLKAENLGAHFNHSQGTATHTNQHKARKINCMSPQMPDCGSTIAPKIGAGNFSSLKLPPGLIIERVEYKQSRPSITKEVPSVTIVARQRQLPVPEKIPTITEHGATDLTIEKPTSLTHSASLIAFANTSSNFVNPSTNSASGLTHHAEPNHTKNQGFGNYSESNFLPRRADSTMENLVPMCKPPVLRTGPCVENRISVTITESNPTHERMQDVHVPSTSVDLSTTSQNDRKVSSYCSTLRKTPLDSVQMRAPQRTASSITPSSLHKISINATGQMPGSSGKTPPPVTTLIIPQVPMPPLSNQAIHPLKRARRKSVFVSLPVPTDESNRDVMAKPLRQQHSIIPSINAPTSSLSGTTGITSANLLASMSLSFIAPGLLPVPGTSMLGPIDMQRLAAVRLPAHLQPPVIPPLKIPDAATSASLLEKIFHPTHSDALSTGLELKKDAQCNQTKQPSSLQPVRTHMYHNTAEDSSTAKSQNMNGFVNQLEQISKINAPPPNIRTDGLRTTDTKTLKSNNLSAASKGSGRITKRRASVADLQRKALMEQIWNQSIIDKMMHEKDARIVAGLEDTSKEIEATTTKVDTEIENNSYVEKVDDRKTRKGEQLTTNAEMPHMISSLSSCALHENNTKRQNLNECGQEISTKILKIPENSNKKILHHNSEEQQQQNATTIPIYVQEKNELQNTQKESNAQLQNKQENFIIPITNIVNKLDDSNTLEHDPPAKEAEPPISSSSINTTDMIKTVDKIDAALEDGSIDTVDCQVSADMQKPASKKVVRKRRKNELASILSDQLLESFKEVDKSRLDDLKLLHDLTCETPDVKFTLEQIPQLAKRKSNPRKPELVIQEPSKIVTSINTTTKKVQNAKRQAKEKEPTSQPAVKEIKSKSSASTFGSIEPCPREVKSNVIHEGKKELIRNSMNDPNDKCSQKTPLDKQESTKVQQNSTEQGVTTQKATRSKTQTIFNGEIMSHNSSRKSSLLTNSELNSDEAGNDRIDDTQERNSFARKRTITSAVESLDVSATNNSTNKLEDAETVTSLRASSTRVTEIVSDKSMDTAVVPKPTLTPPKRIMSRRKSVFVDCDLAQYVEKEEEKLKKESTNVSFKDDLMLTPRRGTRSQGQLGLDLVESLLETTMKPRDPRRRMLQKRREEELNARENKQQLQINNGPSDPFAEQITGVMGNQMEESGSCSVDKKENKATVHEFDSLVDTKLKNDMESSYSSGTQKNAPLRRISARRASVCVRSLTESKNVKECLGSVSVLLENKHLRDIGNEVKRIYKRRASIYQPPTELQQEDEDARRIQSNHHESQSLNSKADEETTVLTKKKETLSQKSNNRRSKTPGPGDWKRRNQLPLNGTSEPLIESLLLHAPDSETNAPKRRTTKNSQIAETVSKLFNIQEEIMLIDSSRRKPRKVNLPTVPAQPEPSFHKQHKEISNSTNEGTEKETENEKCKTYHTIPSVDDHETDEKKSPLQLPRKSFSFSNDEDDSPKAIKKLVENIINNTTNSSNASTDYSDDDNMSLAYFAARSNVPVTNSLESNDMFAKPPSSTPARAMSVIADDESTTNTDALDDDMMSVTTEIPTSTNTSRMGTRRVRRKRRKSRRQNSKIKRQQAKSQEENNKPVQSFNCNLCRKMFKKQDAYNKHRMTLSHIAKLSEQEYLVSQQNQERRHGECLQVSSEDMQLQPKPEQEPQEGQRVEKIVEPSANSIDTPEVLPNASDGSLSMVTLAMTDKGKQHDDPSVKELSQEEKLFFECCSMLKESNSSESDKIKSVTVSLKSNELLNSADPNNPCVVLANEANLLSATNASVHLPVIEQSQTLPGGSVGVLPNTCLEKDFVSSQVSDIHQEETTYSHNPVELGEAAHYMVQRYVVANDSGNISPHNSIKSSSTMPVVATTSSSSSSSSSTSSSSGSNSVNKNNANNAKIKTKGALKGYDNFKVSIPMTGLTVMSTNTVNTGVAVSKESRLDTLADVALCGDIPKEFGIAIQSDEINAATLVRVDECGSTCPETLAGFSETDMFIDSKSDIHSSKLIAKHEKDFNAATITNSSISRTCEQNNSKSMTSNKIGCVKNREYSAKSQNKPSTRWTTGPYRRRMEKNNTTNAEAALLCDHTFLYEADDVYAFQDSPCDGDLPSTYSSKKNSSSSQSMTKSAENCQQQIKHNSTITDTLEDHEDSQMSSLSFSDRDDFVYGTNTMSEEEEEEEDKNSSISSEQTTPKKLTNADVQKKSLIMGRIFKKGGAKDKLISDAGMRKCSTTSPEAPVTEIPPKVAGTAAVVLKSTTTVKSTMKDFDKLFDTLKNDALSANELQTSNEPGSEFRHTASSGEEIFVATIAVKDKLTQYQKNNCDRLHQPGHKDLETTDTGTDRIRRRRTGQQKILTETWDSDEFEDFQTDDIMKLIDHTEEDEVNDNTSPKKRMALHRATEEKIKSGQLECISGDSVKQSSSVTDVLKNEKEYDRIEQILDKHAGSKKGIHSVIDKKLSKSDSTVTDDTIRKVMESVILETMGKSSKRKPIAHGSTLGTDNTAASIGKPLRVSSNSEGNGETSFASNVSAEDVSQALELTSLDDHILESSVVISSKTITSKFKQKLNSSMRCSLSEIGSISDSYDKEPISKESKPLANTSTISDTNSGTNVLLVTTNSKNNNNNKTMNNNNNINSKLFAKSSKAVAAAKSRIKPKCTEEDWTGKTPTVGGKQRKAVPKKMKNIAYDPDSDYEQSIKCKKVKRKLLENDIEANLKIEQLQTTLQNAEDSSILLTTSRRKRNAGDMLYYWSSSSDEEMEKEEESTRTKRYNELTKDTDRRRHCKPINNNNPSVGKKRGRKKKQSENTKSIELLIDVANKQNVNESEKDETKLKSSTETAFLAPAKKSKTNTASTDKKMAIASKTKKLQDAEKSLQIQTLPVQTEEETCGTSSEHLKQHGWIMGDSHKKLVTMLAHAKGKHDSRKQSTVNRKK